MTQQLGSAVTCRIALGPQAGRKTLVLRTITPLAAEHRMLRHHDRAVVFCS